MVATPRSLRYGYTLAIRPRTCHNLGECRARRKLPRHEPPVVDLHGPMAMKRVTIDDVARRAQVSKATVSAVLNHKNVVRPETREQILKAISDLQYRPRPSARVLRSLATERGSIQLLIRELDNPFYSTLALGVMQRASELGVPGGDHQFRGQPLARGRRSRASSPTARSRAPSLRRCCRAPRKSIICSG